MNLIRAAALVALALGACNLNNPGFDSPVGELAYPIAITLSDSSATDGPAAYLYVANSNFDLRYNGGSVQSYDLAALEEALVANKCIAERDEEEPQPVEDGGDAGAPVDAGDMDATNGSDPDAELGDAGLGDAELGDAESSEGGAADADVDARVTPVQIDAGLAHDDTRAAQPRLCDGRGGSDSDRDLCCFTRRNKRLAPLRADEISIDSYAGGITTSPDGAHVYLPVRSQSRLVYLDVDDDGQFSCGTETGRCRRGPKYGRVAEIDDLKYPPTPTAVVTGGFGELNVSERGEKYFVATAHEGGELSLFALNNGSGAPKLLYALRGASASRAASLRMDNDFFLISAASGSEVARVGARSDIEANVDRDPVGVYLYSTQSIVVSGLTTSPDIRDAQPDTRDLAAGMPSRYYALLRGSTGAVLQSVGFLELDHTSPDGRFARAIDAVRVGVGLSKMLQTDLGGRHLLFVSCYQDGEIHVIDADKRQTVSVIRDVLGPTDMQVDRARSLLYVTDFRASVIRVVDLHGLAHGEGGVPRVVATLGQPYLPGNVK